MREKQGKEKRMREDERGEEEEETKDTKDGWRRKEINEKRTRWKQK